MMPTYYIRGFGVYRRRAPEVPAPCPNYLVGQLQFDQGETLHAWVQRVNADWRQRCARLDESEPMSLDEWNAR